MCVINNASTCSSQLKLHYGVYFRFKKYNIVEFSILGEYNDTIAVYIHSKISHS